MNLKKNYTLIAIIAYKCNNYYYCISVLLVLHSGEDFFSNSAFIYELMAPYIGWIGSEVDSLLFQNFYSFFNLFKNSLIKLFYF